MNGHTRLGHFTLERPQDLGLRHNCSRCRALMRLVGIEPSLRTNDASDVHTFECAACGHVAVESVPHIRLM